MSEAHDPMDMPDPDAVFVVGPDGRLHPEGAPGVIPNVIRQLMGDAAFEKNAERSEARDRIDREHTEAHTRLVQAKARMLEMTAALMMCAFLALVVWGLVEAVSAILG